MSLILFGDNKAVSILRSLTAMELYQNVDFYAYHPCMMHSYEHGKDGSDKRLFSNFLSVFEMSRSFFRADDTLEIVELVLKEGLL